MRMIELKTDSDQRSSKREGHIFGLVMVSGIVLAALLYPNLITLPFLFFIRVFADNKRAKAKG